MREKPVGRFAPSPSGRMHLGNLFAAYASRKYVKSRGGVWILRHEDLDRQRCRREYVEQVEDDLNWLGLTWDEGGLEGGGDNGPYLQSMRDDIYRETLLQLCMKGLLYPCSCRRADLLAASAPHASDGRAIYSGKCRPDRIPVKMDRQQAERTLSQWDGMAIRIRVPDEDVEFTDRIAGYQKFNLAKDCGDFVVRRSDGGWAYQLAVVADDAAMGVTEVVRGEDLLPSTAMQIYLYRTLGFPVPDYGHFPLMRNAEGARLSKRDHSMAMDEIRKKMSREEVLEMLHEAFLKNIGSEC